MVPDRKNLVARVRCHCGTDMELWMPPTIRCPVCESLYVWAKDGQCIAAPDGTGMLTVQFYVELVLRRNPPDEPVIVEGS